MRNKRCKYFCIVLCLLIGGNIYAQDFGFGDEDSSDNTGGAAGNGSLSASIGGEISASMIGYLDDFHEGADQTQLGDIFSGKLNFSARTSFAEGNINLKLDPAISPISINDIIDEAYLRAFFGDFEIAAGLRKLTWGKADSFGPLDIINPLDYSRVFTEMSDNASLMDIKIARPLVQASFRFGQFSKIEGVFIPWFRPHYLPQTGKWAPDQMKMLTHPPIPEEIPIKLILPELITATVDYAQAGLRFTTTIGNADIGAQYYYGRLPQPSAVIGPIPISGSLSDTFSMSINEAEVHANLLYNSYHQIGLDYAQVLFDFNTRAELAANITEDLKGDDGAVYNPSIAWSFGFDRDLVWGINLNLQVNESIRLMHDKLGGDMDSAMGSTRNNITNTIITNIMNGTLSPGGSFDYGSFPINNFDIEGGSELTATRFIATLSKKFLRDELELRAAVIWGIEDKDCAILPALIWTKDDLQMAFSGGFFTGDSEGQLGQYWKNNFLKISLTYTF